jgi:hypothetical protein
MLSVIFWIVSCIYAQACLDCDLPIYASHVAGMTGMYHHTQLLLIKMESHKLFCLGWPWTVILSFSTSHVIRITAVSHCVWLVPLFLHQWNKKSNNRCVSSYSVCLMIHANS